MLLLVSTCDPWRITTRFSGCPVEVRADSSPRERAITEMKTATVAATLSTAMKVPVRRTTTLRKLYLKGIAMWKSSTGIAQSVRDVQARGAIRGKSGGHQGNQNRKRESDRKRLRLDPQNRKEAAGGLLQIDIGK